ncbi:MAG: prenyltransferase/squalene oxidase repeat-containing protein, partial [Solirubrobacteraceae bacterium]
MTWQLGALVVLGVALAAGFGWYERARPDARIVALVGTLAAFAALGRIAFAAVPNVKPTTDIVLVAGYALGGGPGFAVGALAGLTSNFFFGQGPWTPWQMAAWGATGMIGAALTVGWGRRIGRWPLAIACGVCGFAFTVVQDCGDWVTYSDHSLTQLGLYVGRGLAYDAVHAIGCVAFALAFGPALIRSLQRFSRRLQVTWSEPGAAPEPGAASRSGSATAALVVLGVTAGLAAGLSGIPGGPAPARAAGSGPAGSGAAAGHAAALSPAAAVGRARAYLVAAENPDGGFGSAPGQSSAGLFTGWAALGLAATGRSPLALNHARHSAIDAISADPPGGDVGALERTILVVRAAGVSPRSVGGHDLLAALARRRRADGSTADQVNLTAFAILALRSAGSVVPGRSYGWLRARQNRDGGFGFAGGAPSDADDTGAVLEALAGAPGASATRTRAVRYLRRAQNRDGGFPAQAGQSSNAQSTAWAMQGLVAAGTAPASVHRSGSPSPTDYLLSLIAPDGSIRYARGQYQTPVWVTGEALMALAGRPLPIAPVPAPAPPPGTPAARAPAAATSGSPAPAAAHRRRARVSGFGRHTSSARPRARAGTHGTPAGRLVAATIAALGARGGLALTA